MKKIDRSNKVRTGFHQAKWDEPVIFELSQAGERGVLVPKPSQEIQDSVGDPLDKLPLFLRRKTPPALPEISQPRVLRHYARLSQQTLGADVNIEIGQGTCTVKYSPKINDQLSRLPGMAELHPLQDESTAQGILQIFYETDCYMREISGMDRFSFQPGGGSQGILAMTYATYNYFKSIGQEDQRDEIITTIYSHPSDAAVPHTKGYKIIYLHPDKDGYPDLEAFREAVSERTAAFFVANPEDTGVYNKRVLEFTKLVHEHGGLAGYDQANANGLFGVTRAKEAGFDMCFFNLHKSFSTPHGCSGPAVGAIGVLKFLEKFIPGPLVDYDGENYHLNYDYADENIGLVKLRAFYGVAPVVLKAYAYIRSMGPDGLYQVAKTSVLNNNYMFKKLMELDVVDAPYTPGRQRVEQVRYTLEKLLEKTGISSADVQRRMMDFGMHIWQSHHPFYIPEPLTLEPTETPSKEDIDEYIETLKYIFEEAKNDPETIKSAPHRSVCHRLDESGMDDPEKWAITWRSYLKKYK